MIAEINGDSVYLNSAGSFTEAIGRKKYFFVLWMQKAGSVG
jgi:hypothetical protein